MGDETKNFGAFAVTMNQIYGSRNVDSLPFGSNSSSAISFDGRIRSQPILSFMPQAMDGPSKCVRVYELSPLAAADKRSYDELVAFFTKCGRCPVVDKEYNLGILLYFVPPKLIFKIVDPLLNEHAAKERKKRKKRAKDGEINKINFVQLLGLNANHESIKEDKVWMISIISTSKYLLYKKKKKDKEGLQKVDKAKKGKKKRNEADLSDIEIDDEDDDDEDDESVDTVDDDGKENKNKEDGVVKSDLIVALEELYKQIGQRLPDSVL